MPRIAMGISVDESVLWTRLVSVTKPFHKAESIPHLSEIWQIERSLSLSIKWRNLNLPPVFIILALLFTRYLLVPNRWGTSRIVLLYRNLLDKSRDRQIPRNVRRTPITAFMNVPGNDYKD